MPGDASLGRLSWPDPSVACSHPTPLYRHLPGHTHTIPVLLNAFNSTPRSPDPACLMRLLPAALVVASNFTRDNHYDDAAARWDACKTLSGGPSCAPDLSAHSNPSLSRRTDVPIRERFFRLGEDSTSPTSRASPSCTWRQGADPARPAGPARPGRAGGRPGPPQARNAAADLPDFGGRCKVAEVRKHQFTPFVDQFTIDILGPDDMEMTGDLFDRRVHHPARRPDGGHHLQALVQRARHLRRRHRVRPGRPADPGQRPGAGPRRGSRTRAALIEVGGPQEVVPADPSSARRWSDHKRQHAPRPPSAP